MRIRPMTAYDLHSAVRLDDQWSIEAWSPYVDYDAVDGEQYSARVLEHSGRIVAAMAYRWHSEMFCVHRIAVAELCRRQGHATSLVNYLKDFLHPERRKRITAHVDEYDLQSQLFLRSCGFAWQATESGFYRLEFRVPEPVMFRATNRLTAVGRA